MFGVGSWRRQEEIGGDWVYAHTALRCWLKDLEEYRHEIYNHLCVNFLVDLLLEDLMLDF